MWRRRNYKRMLLKVEVVVQDDIKFSERVSNVRREEIWFCRTFDTRPVIDSWKCTSGVC